MTVRRYAIIQIARGVYNSDLVIPTARLVDIPLANMLD